MRDAMPDEPEMVDPHTGLANRRALDAVLSRLETEQSGAGLAYAFVDVDHLKLVNDEYGPDVGDQALSAIAQRIRSQLRAGDFACRYGGEEFLIILDNVEDVSQVRDVLELMCTAVALPIRYRDSQRASTGEDSLSLSVTVSIGATLADRAEPASDALMRAGRAMYATAGTGGNCVRLYLPE
ncbi:GGDEF domain-containing protein [Angustibacter luteus]|uniref:GGDEF domain-containing protein n=1 Tax=Angustibacter luteus TaxID=658456 RepID=A0ABW1JG15_9ACTN